MLNPRIDPELSPPKPHRHADSDCFCAEVSVAVLSPDDDVDETDVSGVVEPLRYARNAPLVHVPHGDQPDALYLATAWEALTAGLRMLGTGWLWVPLLICHSPHDVCVPLLSEGLTAWLFPPDSASAMAAATGAWAFGPPALIHRPSSCA